MCIRDSIVGGRDYAEDEFINYTDAIGATPEAEMCIRDSSFIEDGDGKYVDSDREGHIVINRVVTTQEPSKYRCV